MFKLSLGLLVSFLVGGGCRYFAIPAPSPPSLLGASLVLAMTLGYLGVDRFFRCRANTTHHQCGGPSGQTAEEGKA